MRELRQGDSDRIDRFYKTGEEAEEFSFSLPLRTGLLSNRVNPVQTT